MLWHTVGTCKWKEEIQMHLMEMLYASLSFLIFPALSCHGPGDATDIRGKMIIQPASKCCSGLALGSCPVRRQNRYLLLMLLLLFAGIFVAHGCSHVLYFIGKTLNKNSNSHVSCCVTVTNLQHNLFVLLHPFQLGNCSGMTRLRTKLGYEMKS
jgi:hypothetical protein